MATGRTGGGRGGPIVVPNNRFAPRGLRRTLLADTSQWQLLDDFKRASGALGSNWVSPWSNDAGTIGVSAFSGSVVGNAAANSAIWSTIQQADQEAWATIALLPAAASNVNLTLRGSTAANTSTTSKYILRVTPSTSVWEIRKVISGGGSSLIGSTSSHSLSQGDTFGFRAIGSQLEAWWRPSGSGNSGWVLLFTQTDTSITADGYIGMNIQNTVGRMGPFGGGPVMVAQKDVSFTGISTGEAIGSQVVAPGPVDISFSGVTSSEAFGSVFVQNVNWVDASPTNNSFESNVALWTVSDAVNMSVAQAVGDAAPGWGSNSAEITTLWPATLQNKEFLPTSTPIKIVPGQKLRVSAWAKLASVDAGSVNFRLVVREFDAGLGFLLGLTAVQLTSKLVADGWFNMSTILDSTDLNSLCEYVTISVLTSANTGGGINGVWRADGFSQEIGTPDTLSIITLAGITSAQAFGTLAPLSTLQFITGTGIATTEAFGSGVVTSLATITPSGISSAEAFGSGTITTGAVSALPSGLSSAEAFGTQVIGRGAVFITPTGLASVEAIGSAVISVGAVNAAPSGISTGEAFGTQLITEFITPSGVASAQAFGTQVITTGVVNVAPTGVASVTAFGTQVVAPGVASVAPSGIASAQAFGTLGTTINIPATGIVSTESFGTQQVNYIIKPDVVINRVANPRFATTGDTFSNSSSVSNTLAIDATAPTGYSLEVRPTTPGTGTDHYVYPFHDGYGKPANNASSMLFGADYGDWMEVGCWVSANADALAYTPAGNRKATVDMFNQNYAEFPTPSPTVADTWTWVTRKTQLLSDAGAHNSFFIRLYCLAGSNSGTDPRVKFSGLIVRKTSADAPAMVPGDYFDGTTSGAVWLGAADASSSLLGSAVQIASAEAFGSGTVSSLYTIVGTGLASTEVFGTSVITTGAVNVAPSGVTSSEAFGTHVVGSNIAASGLASTEAFGSTTVSPGPVLIIPTGLASAGVFGALAVGLNVALTSIASAGVFGTQVITTGSVSITPTGIASAGAIGSTVVTPGAINIPPSGIGSAEAFGTSVIGRGAVSVAPGGVASAQAFGSSLVTPGAVGISVIGMTTQEIFGGFSSKPSVVGYSDVTDLSNTLVLSVPSHKDGDLLLIFASNRFSQGPISTPVGWTSVSSDLRLNAGTYAQVLTRRANSEPSSYTLNADPSTGIQMSAQMVALSGIDHANVTSNLASNSIQTAPAITAEGSDALVLRMYSSASTPIPFYTLALQDTLVGAITSAQSSGSGYISQIIGYERQVGSAAITSRNATWSQNNAYCAYTVESVPSVSITNDVAVNLKVSLSGIPSAEAFGTTKFTLYLLLPAGVSSAEAVGTADVEVGPLNLPLSGIGSAGAFGTQAIIPGPVTVSVDAGIATAEALGVAEVAAVVSPSAIGSAEAFGTSEITTGPVDVNFFGIIPEEAFGAQSLLGHKTLTLTGIISREAFGVDSLNHKLPTVGGIASATAFGTAIVKGRAFVSTIGIASAQGFGSYVINPPVAPVSFNGLASAQTFGALVTKGRYVVTATGIASLSAVSGSSHVVLGTEAPLDYKYPLRMVFDSTVKSATLDDYLNHVGLDSHPDNHSTIESSGDSVSTIDSIVNRVGMDNPKKSAEIDPHDDGTAIIDGTDKSMTLTDYHPTKDRPYTWSVGD